MSFSTTVKGGSEPSGFDLFDEKTGDPNFNSKYISLHGADTTLAGVFWNVKAPGALRGVNALEATVWTYATTVSTI